MRFKCNILLSKTSIPVEYRRAILSFLKHAIQETGKEEFFDRYFFKEVAKKKPYTYNVNLDIDKKNGKMFDLKSNNATFYFSSADNVTFYIFKNAIIAQKNKPFAIAPGIYMIVTDVIDEKETIIKNTSVIAKIQAPICITKTVDNDNSKRKYLTFKDESFKELFKIKTGLEFVPIECRTTKIWHFDSYIDVTTGLIMLQGPIEKIKEVYLNGIGDRSSQGFGYIDVI